MTTAAATHLVIADDHPLFRDALRQAVAGVLTSAVISEAGSFDDLTSLLERESDVDLLLLHLSMPGISGFSGLISLPAPSPPVPVGIVSTSHHPATPHDPATAQSPGVESGPRPVTAPEKLRGGRWRQDPTRASLPRVSCALMRPLLCCHHLLGAPLAEQGAQRSRFDRLVQDCDVFLARGAADMRAAIRRDQDGRNVFTEAAANLPDRRDAVAAVEMIVHQPT